MAIGGLAAADTNMTESGGKVFGQALVIESDQAEPDTSMVQCGYMMPGHARVVIGDTAVVDFDITDSGGKVSGRAPVSKCDTAEPDMSVAECRECVDRVTGQVSVSECGMSEPDTSLTKHGKKGERMLGKGDQARVIIGDLAAPDMNMTENGGNVLGQILVTECGTAEPDTSMAGCVDMVPGQARDVADMKMTELGGEMSDRAPATVCETAELDPSVTKCKERVASPARVDGLAGADMNKNMTEYGEMVPGRARASEVKITSLMRRLADPFVVKETTLAAAEASFRRGKNIALYTLYIIDCIYMVLSAYFLQENPERWRKRCAQGSRP